MAVTVTNLTMGPGTIYTGLFGAVEPLDTVVNTTPAASSWTDVGGTLDGVKTTVDQKYTMLECDQVVDAAGRRLTSREITVGTNMAELTLDNLALTLNDSTTASGSGYRSLEPAYATSATQPTYRALMLDGYAPNSKRRRVIVRKSMSTDKVEFAYMKDKQAVYTVQWSAHFVTTAIAPFKVVDEQ
jgi:hypothetical protein